MGLIDIENLEVKILEIVEQTREAMTVVEFSKEYKVRKDWLITDKELTDQINTILGQAITSSINEMILETLVLNHGSKELLESYNDLQSRSGKIVKAHFDELAGGPRKVTKDPAKIAVLILQYLNEARHTINPRLKPFPADPGILKYIKARLKEKKTYEDFIKVIDFKCKQWKKKPGSGKNMEPYLRPKTLFNAEHFADYLVEAESAADEQKPAEEKEGWME